LLCRTKLLPREPASVRALARSAAAMLPGPGPASAYGGAGAAVTGAPSSGASLPIHVPRVPLRHRGSSASASARTRGGSGSGGGGDSAGTAGGGSYGAKASGTGGRVAVPPIRAAGPPDEADVEAADLQVESARGSADPNLTDAESASGTEVETQSSSNVDPLEDLDRARALMEQTLNQRWQCDLCYDHFQHETSWRLGDEGCSHSLCRQCVLGCIRWGVRCPYDNVQIPPIVICGAMGTGEYIYHEKCAEVMSEAGNGVLIDRVQRTGGIACVSTDCPGVAPAVDELEGGTAAVAGRRSSTSAASAIGPGRPTACSTCGTRVCGRRVCGAPWTHGHRCWDVLERERRSAEHEMELRMLHRTLDVRAIGTRRRLAKGPRIRPCPHCGVMVEHAGGCNMVYHDSCQTRFCFICRRVGTCSDFDCRKHSDRQPASSKASSSEPNTPLLTPRVGMPITKSRFSQVATSAATALFAVLTMFIVCTIYACWGFLGISGLPRSGFLGETCQTAACGSAQDLATASAVALVDP